MSYDLSGEDILGEDMLGEDLLGEDILGEDLLGEDLLGEDILGAVARPRMTTRQRRVAQARAMLRARVRQSQSGRGVALARMPGGQTVRALPPMMQSAPGLSQPSAGKVQILPLGQFAFTSLSAGFVVWTARPQIPVRPRRLLIDFTRTGPTATGLLTVTQFQIATRSQLASAGPVPAGMFGPTATDIVLICDPAQPGTDIVVQVAISALPGVGDTVDISAGLICDAVA